MNDVIIAAIVSVPPTLASLAALLKARQAESNTRPNGRGTLVGMVEKVQDDVGDVLDWQVDHDREHSRLVRRVEHAENDLDSISDTGRIPSHREIHDAMKERAV